MNKKRYKNRYSTKQIVTDFYKNKVGLPKRKRLFIKLKCETFRRNKDIMQRNSNKNFMTLGQCFAKAGKEIVRGLEMMRDVFNRKNNTDEM